MFYIIGALFAIVIGVILTINVMGGGNQGDSSSQVAATVTEVNQIRMGVKSLGFTNNFAGIDSDVLETGGVMPHELIKGAVGSGNDVDTWGGSVQIYPGSSIGVSNGYFAVSLTQVPQGACIALAMEIGGASGPGWGRANVNWEAWMGNLTQPLTPSEVLPFCDQGSANQVTWLFND